MQEALIIWEGKNNKVDDVIINWRRLFQEEYFDDDAIEKYKDELGRAELHPKGRILIYNKQSSFSIGMTKVVEK
mgnify:CR=1 FL=1